MRSQGILATVEARGWICESHSPLPAGMEEHTPVTVLALDAPQLVVVDAGGRERTVFHWQVDCGVNFCGPAGNWMHESKRQVLDALEKELAQHLSKARPAGIGGTAHDSYNRFLRWTLERNGRAVKS